MKLAFFLKIRLIFNILYRFCMFVNKHLHISGLHISERKWCIRLIVINEIRQISRNWPKQGPKFRKLQEVIWLTVINKIFQFPPRLGPFCQINYLFEIFSGYPKDPTRKWYIWPSFQTSRKRFRKLQEAILLTVIDEIFKAPPHFDLFFQVNCLYKLSLGYPKDPTQKWYIWASFETSRKRFRKLQEAIWLTVINEIFIFYHISTPFVRSTICMNSSQTTPKTQLKNDTSGSVSRLLKKDFVNYRKPFG